MKKITLTWIVISFFLAASLLIIGLKLSKKNAPYKSLENDIIEGMKIYYGQDENLKKLPGKNKTSKVTLSELESFGVDIDNIINGDTCSGYGIVFGENFGYTYKAFIKCSKYTTNNYKNN